MTLQYIPSQKTYGFNHANRNNRPIQIATNDSTTVPDSRYSRSMDPALAFALFERAVFFADNEGRKRFLGARTSVPPSDTPTFYAVGDLFLNSAPEDAQTHVLGWQCVANDATATTWKTLYALAPAAAVPDVAAAAPAAYDPQEIDKIVAELRDLKAKMKTAGLLQP